MKIFSVSLVLLASILPIIATACSENDEKCKSDVYGASINATEPLMVSQVNGKTGQADKPCGRPSVPSSGIHCANPSLRASEPGTVWLETHMPNRFGFSRDSDDVNFVDFTLSVQHPMFYDVLQRKGASWLPYLAFTGRFGQYIETRPSSPLIAKQFNPKLFLRKFVCGGQQCTVEDKDNTTIDYIDFEYAHLSNGQSVDSIDAFNINAINSGNAEFAKDYISRGWDYFGVSGKYHPNKADKKLSIDYGFKHYVGGLFQKNIDEYFSWEAPRDIARLNQVSGLALSASYNCNNCGFWNGVTIGLETGTNQPFKYNTVRAELGAAPGNKIFGIPIVLTVRSGYNSDLAQYYKKTTSIGVALNFTTFR